jgi:hypothetical protein
MLITLALGQFLDRLFIPAQFLVKPCSPHNALSFPRIDQDKLDCDE